MKMFILNMGQCKDTAIKQSVQTCSGIVNLTFFGGKKGVRAREAISFLLLSAASASRLPVRLQEGSRKKHRRIRELCSAKGCYGGGGGGGGG